MHPVLERHKHGGLNYSCTVLLDKMGNGSPITRPALRQAVSELFENFQGDVIFYFAGHGVLTQTGGFLCTRDAEKNDWGVPMQEIVQLAMDAKARDILIILDCCHSGDFANPSLMKNGPNPLATIRENMTVIASSRAVEDSIEAGGHGVFTAALLDALNGGAADHMGWVTAAAIYSYVERRFGSNDQRPVFKSHTTDVSVVRECEPIIELLKLRRLVEFFPQQDYKYPLDPEYDPEDENGNVHEPVNQKKWDIGVLFKEYRDAGLLKPSVPREQLFWTARRRHTVELTPRGKEYWWLVARNKI
jgi:hypothetical protein